MRQLAAYHAADGPTDRQAKRRLVPPSVQLQRSSPVEADDPGAARGTAAPDR